MGGGRGGGPGGPVRPNAPVAGPGAGDRNGDEHGDLIARTAKGDLYRYAGNGTGGVTRGVKIATGWKAYASLH